MQNPIKIITHALCYALCVASSTFASEPETKLQRSLSKMSASLQGSLHLGWENKYFSEGRDSLDGDSLTFGSVELGLGNFTGGIWYGESAEQSYNELQISVVFTQSIKSVEYYLGYTHFRFPSDKSHDNEVGAGIAWNGLPLSVELSIDAYYSFDADGYFAEIAATRELALTDKLSLMFTLPLGINQGYINDGHDGANYIALRAGVDYAITEGFSTHVHASRSWEIAQDTTLAGDEQLVDFFHAGIGFTWSF